MQGLHSHRARTPPEGRHEVSFPVLSPLIRRDLVKQQLRFKQFCESQIQSLEA